MLEEILLLLIALMVCVTVHEAAHAWVAYKLGDPTPKVDGRVSLNPAKHLDFLGTLMIFLVQFGWGKPVVFNYHNLRHPRRDSALVAIAGPLTNLLTAAVIFFLIKYLGIPVNTFSHVVLKAVYDLSIVLFLFNLIPIAPLDGSKIIGFFVPKSKEMWYQGYLSQGPIYLIVLIIGDRLLAQTAGFSFLGAYVSTGYSFMSGFIQLNT